MSILIGADIVPTESNRKYFSSGDMKSILGSNLIDFLEKATFRVFNLECPLVDSKSQIQKAGPALMAPISSINGIKVLGVDLLTLANNHIMDQGEKGLLSTLNVLDENDINYFGVGSNLMEAQRSFITYINKRKIGFYACVEHEFSIADEKNPGANPFDVLESFDHVSCLKKQCDSVIVLYHGGKEHYRYPSPFLQRVCRKFIENGADIVICQHSHCIGCEEKYQNGLIVYGQGNFIFDSHNHPTSQTSLLMEIDDEFKVKYIPLEKNDCGVRLASEDCAKKILSDFFSRSEQIKKKGFLEDEYVKFSKRMLKEYLLMCSGYHHNFLKRIVNKIFGHKFTSYFALNYYKKNELLAIRNFVECEAHRELLITGLKND